MADTVPLFDTSAAYPFTGFVFNLNSRSQGHLDGKDWSICIVIPIGEFDRGELVLEELGLVLCLNSGDCIAFRSQLITHYNLDFIGRRVSIACQTDRELRHIPARQARYKQHGLAPS